MNAIAQKINLYCSARNFIWIMLGAVCILSISAAIAQMNPTYLAISLLPLIIYMAIAKPFIFPFGLYVLLLPFEGILVVTGSSHGPTVTRMLGIFTIIALVIKGAVEKRLVHPQKIAMWWTLYIIYGFLSSVWAIQPALVFPRLLTALGLLLLYLVLASFEVQKKDYETIKNLTLMGGFIAAVFMIFQFTSLDPKSATRVSLVLGEAEAGVNKQGLDMLIPVAIGISKIIEARNMLYKAMFAAIVVVCIFAIIITGSRGNLAAVLSILVVYLLSVRGLKKKVILSSIFVLAAVAIIPFIPQFIIDRILESVESHASGRSDIWIVGFKALEKYWLLGAGLDNFIKAYTEFVSYSPAFMGLDRASHNIFVGQFVELGLVGISIMIIAMVKHYRAIRTIPAVYDSDQSMLRAAFFGIIVASMSLDIIWYKTFWFLWILIVMHKSVIKSDLKRGFVYSYHQPLQTLKGDSDDIGRAV